jgi:hypothetical protein
MRTTPPLRLLAAVAPVALIFVSISASPLAAQADGEEMLTNQSVIGMVTGKLNKDLVLAKIASTRNEFDISASGIVNLHESKVPQDVIRSMMSAATDPKLGRAGAGGDEILSNHGIVAMTTARVPRQIVLAKISSTPNDFDITVSALVSLQQSRVAHEVVTAMMGSATDGRLGRNGANAAEVLTNQGVVALIQGRVPKQVVLGKIQNTNVNFDVSAEGMVALNQSKVPQDVIKAMVLRASSGG